MSTPIPRGCRGARWRSAWCTARPDRRASWRWRARRRESPLTSLLYVLIFGVGSIVGMSLLTLVASRPLQLAERRAARLHLIFVSLAGGVAVLIGVQLMGQTAATAFGAFPFGASLGA